MDDLQDMLRVQARLHRRQGAVALADLFGNARGEIETLRTQLAKANEDYKVLFSAFQNCHDELVDANERLKELEQINLELAANVEACCELTEMDMVAAIDRLFEIDNTESKELLNKFAIEKKIEGAYAVISLLDETKDSKTILMANNYVREQLRKEQSHD